ncbi:hypothetical protein E2C01_098502 [Portunus trituberculatus]|uniref:Uncharacterized protein n=1 Tax=Portunus trituberculatus TaxID=210409 RepID=A0A5B7JXZ9_PORTR|nr:hypothetical protein [Portunus trituberculatus]
MRNDSHDSFIVSLLPQSDGGILQVVDEECWSCSLIVLIKLHHHSTLLHVHFS